MKRLIFDLTKIPLLKCLISIYRLIAEVLHDQNLFTELNFGDWFSSYVQFYSGGHDLQLLGRVDHLVFHLSEVCG